MWYHIKLCQEYGTTILLIAEAQIVGACCGRLYRGMAYLPRLDLGNMKMAESSLSQLTSAGESHKPTEPRQEEPSLPNKASEPQQPPNSPLIAKNFCCLVSPSLGSNGL